MKIFMVLSIVGLVTANNSSYPPNPDPDFTPKETLALITLTQVFYRFLQYAAPETEISPQCTIQLPCEDPGENVLSLSPAQKEHNKLWQQVMLQLSRPVYPKTKVSDECYIESNDGTGIDANYFTDFEQTQIKNWGKWLHQMLQLDYPGIKLSPTCSVETGAGLKADQLDPVHVTNLKGWLSIFLKMLRIMAPGTEISKGCVVANRPKNYDNSIEFTDIEKGTFYNWSVFFVKIMKISVPGFSFITPECYIEGRNQLPFNPDLAEHITIWTKMFIHVNRNVAPGAEFSPTCSSENIPRIFREY